MCIVQHVLVGLTAHVGVDLPVALADVAPGGALDGFESDLDRASALADATTNAVVARLACQWRGLARLGLLQRVEHGSGLAIDPAPARAHALSQARRLGGIAAGARPKRSPSSMPRRRGAPRRSRAHEGSCASW